MTGTAAVYNRYWSTGGGAEKVGAVIAETLATDRRVTLLGHRDIDPAWLSERFGVDLSGCAVQLLPDAGDAVTEASAAFDVFVNSSYMSHEHAAAGRNLYYVHFPSPLIALPTPFEAAAARVVGRFGPREVSYRLRKGFHSREVGFRAPVWTNGHGIIEAHVPAGKAVRVSVLLGHHRPPDAGPANLRVLVDGVLQTAPTLAPPSSRLDRVRGVRISFDVVGPPSGEPALIELLSSTFVPAELTGGDDIRQLGVPVLAVAFGRGPMVDVAQIVPAVAEALPDRTWLDTYDAILSNSVFTSGWVRRYWEVETEVLYPPVTMFPALEKEPIIIAAGRFFPADQGHSKKQLELVQAFRRLLGGGLSGWQLHLVGGCGGDTSYLDQVRAASEGLPVVFHVDAPGAELADLYGRASIFWHAAGLGEDGERHPDRLEHFGITTVEAMSAGCVPVVVDLAGQAEIVRHGVDGYRFRSVRDLAELTQHLIVDRPGWERFSAAARRRAATFSIDHFRAGLLERVNA